MWPWWDNTQEGLIWEPQSSSLGSKSLSRQAGQATRRRDTLAFPTSAFSVTVVIKRACCIGGGGGFSYGTMKLNSEETVGQQTDLCNVNGSSSAESHCVNRLRTWQWLGREMAERFSGPTVSCSCERHTAWLPNGEPFCAPAEFHSLLWQLEVQRSGILVWSGPSPSLSNQGR